MKRMAELVKENQGNVKEQRLRTDSNPSGTSTPRTGMPKPTINESTIAGFEESRLDNGAGTANLVGNARERTPSTLEFQTETNSKLVQIKIDIQAFIAKAQEEHELNVNSWLDNFEDGLATVDEQLIEINEECLEREVTDFCDKVESLSLLLKETHERFKDMFMQQTTNPTSNTSAEDNHQAHDIIDARKSPQNVSDENINRTDDDNTGSNHESNISDTEEVKLDNQINTLFSEIDRLDGRIDDLGDLKALVQDMTSQYSKNENDITGLKNDLKTYVGDVNQLKEENKRQADLIKMLKFRSTSTRPPVQRPVPDTAIRALQSEMENVSRSLNRSHDLLVTPGGTPQSSNQSGIIKMYKSKLEKYIKSISTTCSENDITEEISNRVIIDFHNNVLSDLDKDMKECDTMLAKYMTAGGDELSVINAAEFASVSGKSWSDRIKHLYRSKELHLNSSGKGLFNAVPLFKNDGKITVYEFLKCIKEFTQNDYSSLDCAKFLVSKLSDSIKIDVINIAEDFKAVEAYLIKRYGRIRDIITSKVGIIKSTKHPDNTTSSLVEYYKKVRLTLNQIANLHKSGNVPSDKLHDHIHKTEFVIDVLGMLHDDVYNKYIETLLQDKLSLSDLEGKHAFELLIELCSTECERLELRAQIPKSISQSKTYPVEKSRKLKDRKDSPKPIQSANKVNIDSPGHRSRSSSSSSCGSPKSTKVVSPKLKAPKSKKAVNHASNSKNTSQVKDGQRQRPSWYDKSLKFPCPIAEHSGDDSHELGSCADFFAKSGTHKKAIAYQKLCWTCMGPRDKCNPKCINYKRMPESLICSDCKNFIKGTTRSPLCVLMCSKEDHGKPDIDDLADSLEKWLPGFQKSKEMKGSIKQHALLVAVTQACTCGSDKTVCNCSFPQSLTRKPSDNDTTPCFNTSNGDCIEDIDNETIINEVVQDSMYIMQMLNLGGEECLTFFDSGSNQHLMEGPLAERLNLKVISPDNMSIGTVGGKRIWTNYGIYSMILGPDTDGDWHEMFVQGISCITDPFRKYSLSVLNKEVKSTKQLPVDTVYPEFIGGMDVKLLIGIKDASIYPKPKFTLPNGLGVFESEFEDTFGSRICYGGPHQLITQVNKSGNGSFNLIRCYLSEMAGSYKRSLYSSLQLTFGDIISDLDDDLGISVKEKGTVFLDSVVEPTPLNSEDFIDAGCADPIAGSNLLEPSDEFKIPNFTCDTRQATIPKCDICLIRMYPTPTQSCHKSTIPLSKSKGLIDEGDIENIVEYRCPTCSRCTECKESSRYKTRSLQETMEQEIIEKSVHVDLDAGKVFVDLPFIVDPVKALSKRHKGNNNYYQARASYKTQCKKSPEIKANIRKVHKDLVDKGFMVRLQDLPKEKQELISKAAFLHYFTWKSVVKVSRSTPVRLVVDPSITGLNQTLAKGSNHLNKIHDIIMRARCKPFIWTADVSKLYNCLYLNDSALPFCLFLYQQDLCDDLEPEVWVMSRAWYGVISSGGQSGNGMVQACELQPEKPLALDVVRNDTYVDDTLSGAMTKEDVLLQISDTESALAAAGFHFKYIVHSGTSPPECATSDADGVIVSLLGHKWAPKDDVIGLGFQEVNFNKKVQGAKKANPFPVITPEDVERLARSSCPITRKIVVSKLAEIWDPTGLFEPYKLQLKLEALELKGLDWDKPLDKDTQDHWIRRFKEFVQLPFLIAPRCVVPSDAVNPSQIRLLCLSDAAVTAGGAAIYATYLLRNGSYSCQLLTAKSRVLKMSIPRNELSAVLELSKLTYSVKKALGNLVTEVRYFTDSTIALCWVSNTTKKLRMFTYNRVAEIRRCIEWTVGDISQELPLYHIDGDHNVADMLTKPHELTPDDLGPLSRWQKGDPWMNLPFTQMPITKYEELTVSEKEDETVNSECFKEIEVATVLSFGPTSNLFDGRPCSEQFQHCITCTQSNLPSFPWDRCYGITTENGHCLSCSCKIVHTSCLAKVGGSASSSRYMVDIVQLGWLRSTGTICIVLSFTHSLIHRAHGKPTMSPSLALKLQKICLVCKDNPESEQALMSSVNVTTRAQAKSRSLKIVYHKPTLITASKDYLFRIATAEVIDHYGVKKVEQLFQTDSKGIVVYTGRLSKEDPISTFDLDFHAFYDAVEIKSVVPVVLSTSRVFYTYLMYVHQRLRPHAGVESTLREIMKIMHVPNARTLISKIRRDCPKCRILAKKTVDLHMENHHAGRTTFAPPFYNIQVDIAMCFKAKPFLNSRTRIDCHCLVIVCLLSGATSLLVMEDLKAQSVVSCLERHSSRYGVPYGVYVDAGTQLAKLVDVEFSIRDINLDTYDSMGFKVVIGVPKSHEDIGRAESKVKALKEMLTKLSVTADKFQTLISWETTFQKIANQLDNLPIAKGTSSNLYDHTAEIITANRLKLGRNNFRSPESDLILTNSPSSLLERSRLVSSKWYELFKTWIHHLVPKPKWFTSGNVAVGDVCLFLYEDGNQPKLWTWKLGQVIKMDSKRKLTIGYFLSSSEKMKTVSRRPRQISVIFSEADLALNTTKHYDRLVADME